jgi:hypothetical protein
MKKLFATLAIAMLSFTALQAQTKYEFQMMTSIESVVPGGLGRSRLITQNSKGEMEEIKLDNFFSLVGINFGNIKDNNRVLTEKIQKMADEGWILDQTIAGVYSHESSTGIFITRYIFKREKK